MTAPCVWPVDTRHLDRVGGQHDPSDLRAAIDLSVSVLWALTGRQFGVCTTVARPCPRDRDRPGNWLSGWLMPILDAGVWRNITCDTTAGCRREGRSVVLLPGPVHRIVGVAVDGARIDDDSWTAEWDWLYRSGGQDWPEQDLSAPPGAPGTWSVTYERGTPPPAGADTMVGQLAAEFLLSGTSPDRCALPRNTRQIVRQGVTVHMADPNDIIAAGSTGIPEVDLWVRAINPHRLTQNAVVWSPDMAVQ